MSYVCEVCNSTFSNHRQLNGHKSVHRAQGRYSVSRKRKPETACQQCQTMFNSRDPHARFCSVSCFNKNKWTTVIKVRVECGECSHPETLKKYLSETRGYRCEDCSSEAFHNGKPLVLQLDHIDGNSDNNSPSNLRLLCPNCHSQTETYAGRGQTRKPASRNRYLRRFKGYSE